MAPRGPGGTGRSGMAGWERVLSELAARREHSRAMGGADRLARHRAAGKLDARARVCRLLDPGSFAEFGTLAGGSVPADGLVAGSGTIDGRPVMVGAEDFTTLAGTIGPAGQAKRCRLAELALLDRVPLVMLLEGAGYRGGERGGRAPVDVHLQLACSGKVPLVTAVLGASAGHGALVAPLSDFVVMTEGAAIFTAGPPVVKEATGEEVTKEQLGGPTVAVGSGLVHNVVADDAAALDQIRRYLSYFPSSAWSYPPRLDTEASDGGGGDVLEVVPSDPRAAYDMAGVLRVLVDDGELFEIAAGYGASVLCVLARLGGHPVAVVANQPKVLAGALDAAAAEKAAHFIEVANAFHLPLVFLADNPGMLPGTASERAGVLRRGARMLAAEALATTPKLHVTVRKAYGFGSLVMAMVPFDRQSASFALPGATLGAMGSKAAAAASRAGTAEGEALRRDELEAAFRSAEHLGFDEIVDPRRLRQTLLQALTRALSRRQVPPAPVEKAVITP